MMGFEDFMSEVEAYDKASILNMFNEKKTEFMNTLIQSNLTSIQTLEAATAYCQEKSYDSPLRIGPTSWNQEFIIEEADCKLINSPSGGREELRQRYDSDPRIVVQPTPGKGQHIGI